MVMVLFVVVVLIENFDESMTSPIIITTVVRTKGQIKMIAFIVSGLQ
jgi:hypothetical protein